MPSVALRGGQLGRRLAPTGFPNVAAVNLVFIDHFTEVARGHFAVRRLERAHGAGSVRAAWLEL